MSERYSVGELAEVAGVARRTVRYYVQEELLFPPVGRGRSAYYTRDHLDRLLRVKGMQEQGLSLAQIRRALDPSRPRPTGAIMASLPRVERSLFTKVELGPGVELHLAAGRRVPSSARLSELVEWCRRYIQNGGESEE